MTTPIDLDILDNAAALAAEMQAAAHYWANEIDDAAPGTEIARTARLIDKAAETVADTFDPSPLAIPSPLELEPRPILEIIPDYQDALAALAAEVYDADPDFAETVIKAAQWVESTAPIVADFEVEKLSNIHVAGVFRWTGNSTKKIRDLINLVPTDPPIEKWVEPCAGSCAIYLGLMHRKPEIFAKCKEVILNDKDQLLIDSLKFLRGLRGEAKVAFQNRQWVRTTEHIKKLRAWAPTTKADQIYRFVYLLYSSATRGHITPPKGAAEKSHWLTEIGRKIPIDHVLEQAARLRGVKLTCEDAVDVIKRHAGEPPSTMIALDPPYSKVNNASRDFVYGQASGVDYEALAGALRGSKARAFLLIDKSPQQRKRWSFLRRVFGWKRHDSLAAMQGRAGRFYYDDMYSNFGKQLEKAVDGDDGEQLEKRIVSRGGRFCVLAETSDRSFGCYDTKAEAEVRLQQLERFKADTAGSVREKLAELSHRQWAGWAEHMLERLDGPDAADHVERWKRQIGASYDQLSEAERKADRHEADRVIEVLRGLGIEIRKAMIGIESAGQSGIRGVVVTDQGYVQIKVGQSHPLANHKGYVYLHTLVWISAGRKLPKGGGRYSGTDTILDHVNRLKDDNRISNLRDMTRGEHAIRTTEDNVRDGKLGRKLRKALEHADEAEHRIAKADEAERFILCVVLEPNDGDDGAPLDPDAHKDIYSEAEIYRAAHWYMERYQKNKFQHGRGSFYRGEILGKAKVQILESTIVRWPGTMTDPQGKVQKIHAGTWLLGLKIHDDRIWKKILRGEITGLSIGGTAVRTPAKGLTLPGEDV